MCGIIGVLSNSNDAETKVRAGMLQLLNRGYDSVGTLSLANGSADFCIEKHVTDVKMAFDKLSSKPRASHLCIGHTRWATHGPKTIDNAHPHLDMKQTVAIVHNGIIENYAQLKKSLVAEGWSFSSETDTEVVVNLLAKSYAECGDRLKSVKKTLSVLEGTWGLVIVFSDTPNTLYCTRKGSPLLVATSDNAGYVTSEQSGFCGSVVNYISLDDGEICEMALTNSGVTLKTFEKEFDQYNAVVNSTSSNMCELGHWPHWMKKEIYEQPDSSMRALGQGGRINQDRVRLGGLEGCPRLSGLDHLLIIGCGTSYHAGLMTKLLFCSVCTFTSVQVIDASNFSENEIPKRGKICAILVSQSGETRDLQKIIPSLRNLDIVTIGVINAVGSQIARDVDCGVYCNAGREVSVASTKSFSSQVICLSLIALWFSQRHQCKPSLRQRVIDSLRRVPQDIRSLLQNDRQIMEVAKKLSTVDSCFMLGRLSEYATALEGALKIKETTGLHAEGFPLGSLKHGPFGLLTVDTPVVLSDITCHSLVESCKQEILARHAPVIVIGCINTADILVPKNEYFGPLLSAIALQMVAYDICLVKDRNPDFPKNLAKVVTTD